MGPADPAALAELALRGVDELGLADLFKSLGRDLADNQFPAFVEHPYLLLAHPRNG